MDFTFPLKLIVVALYIYLSIYKFVSGHKAQEQKNAGISYDLLFCYVQIDIHFSLRIILLLFFWSSFSSSFWTVMHWFFFFLFSGRFLYLFMVLHKIKLQFRKFHSIWSQVKCKIPPQKLSMIFGFCIFY